MACTRMRGPTPILVPAAAQQDAGRKARLIVVGSGGKNRYTQLIEKLHVPGTGKKVLFLGSVSHIQNVLSICDVAVLPTFYDPSSRFILEALAAGKPVITTAFNGATDLFVKDRHGKVIDRPSDVRALSEALCHFTDTANIESASKAIRQDKLEENISISRAAGELTELYETILSDRGKK